MYSLIIFYFINQNKQISSLEYQVKRAENTTAQFFLKNQRA